MRFSTIAALGLVSGKLGIKKYNYNKKKKKKKKKR